MPDNVLVATLNKPQPKEAPKKEVKDTAVENRDIPQVKVDVKPPFTQYEKMEGKPYTVDFFKLDGWDFINEDGKDIDKVVDKVLTIEDYVKGEIKRLKLEDSVGSYKEIIDRIQDELHISKNTEKSSRLERIFLYMKLLKKQHQLDQRRREILNGTK